MRVGLFSDTYFPDINGVVTSISNLKKGLENLGHKVFVITNHTSLTKTKFEDDVLYLPGVELKFLYGYTLSTPIHREASEIVASLELDVIHIHSEFGVGLFGRTIAKKLRIPVVTTYHTQYEDYTHYVNFLGLQKIEDYSRKVVAQLSRVYSKNVQIIIAPSSKTKHMLEGYNINKQIEVIPSGLDLEKFERVDFEKNASLKKQLGLDHKFVINYTGRLAKEKSIDLVLECFSELIQTVPHAHFMIVGDGPYRQGLEDLTKNLNLDDHVTFIGSVGQNEIVPYYQISDAFVSASLTETQGLTFIEALANGLCVFARYDEPLKEIIIEDKTGYYFEDAASFVEKVNYYLNLEDKDVLKDHAKTVIHPYDLRTFGSSVLDTYQKAIDQYHGKLIVEEMIDLKDDKVAVVTKVGNYEDIHVFDAELIESKELRIGMELSRNELENLNDEQNFNEALQISFRRLAMRDYTSYEMREYINGKVDLTHDEMDRLIQTLEERRFINDARYIRDKIDYHHDQLRGNGWIIEDLKKRGYDALEIDPYLSELDDQDYLSRALKRGESYVNKNEKGSKLQRKQKLRAHLSTQGFESSVIKYVENILVDTFSDHDEKESLKKDLVKAYNRYLRKLDDLEAKDKAIQYMRGRGYQYETIKAVMEEIENDTD